MVNSKTSKVSGALEVVVSGIRLRHPVMNASGLLGSNTEGILRLVESGVSAVVTKTLTLEPREGYLPPITIPLGECMLNAVGFANPGIDAVGELVRAIHDCGLPAIVSIGGRNADEFIALAVKAEEAGADALELNMSCPHTPGYGVDVSKTIEAIKNIVSGVKSVTNIPVWVKLGYSRLLLRKAGTALSAGADALVLINTVPGMVIDVYSGKPILTNRFGGLSGKCIHPVAVYSIYMVYKEYRCEIVGVGGVQDWKTAIELIEAGAKALQVATAFYTKGYGIVYEILSGLTSFLEEINVKNITELVGLAHRR